MAAVGGLLGQDFDAYFIYGAGSLDWSQYFTALLDLPGHLLTAAWTAVLDLFQGQLANALLYTLAFGDDLVFAVPDLVVFGTPALVEDTLLSLVGL